MDSLVARASARIAAPPSAVWSALLRPETVPRILPVTEVVAPWRPGERFEWRFRLGELDSRVVGTVLEAVEGRRLAYTFIDPHTLAFAQREVVHRVVIELEADGEGTRVSVTQDGNESPAIHRHAEGGWRMALNHLRGLVEEEQRVVR